MSLRDKLNQNQGAVIAGVSVVIVLVVLLCYLTLRNPGGGSNGPHYRPDKAYFSDDDGHSWFIDDANKIPPFDHNGRKAYRAALFLDSTDRKFVGYLESYDPAVKEKMESELKSGTSLAEVMQENPPNVKSAVGGGWSNKPKSLEYGRIISPLGPDKKPPKTGRLTVTDADIAAASAK